MAGLDHGFKEGEGEATREGHVYRKLRFRVFSMDSYLLLHHQIYFIIIIDLFNATLCVSGDCHIRYCYFS